MTEAEIAALRQMIVEVLEILGHATVEKSADAIVKRLVEDREFYYLPQVLPSELCGHDGCERPRGHLGDTHASMIGPEELMDKFGITENQTQEWANEAEQGYDPARFTRRDPT